MPDEVGMEATHSDTPSADDSLFGDVPDNAAPAVVEEDASDDADAEEQTEQDNQGSNDDGDETGSSGDLKVVVSLKGGRATIGVQRPSADPHIESFDDAGLSRLTGEVPAVIERARARWEDEPKHPAHERPAPPARRQPRRSQAAAQAETAEGETEPEQSETLRLF